MPPIVSIRRVACPLWRVACLGAMLGALFAVEGRACVAAYPAAPSPSPGTLAAAEAIPPFPAPGFDGLPRPDEWNPAAGAPLLSSNLDTVPDDESAPPDSPAPGGLLLPILIVILGGAAWRYYGSPAYRRLYGSLYGPLNQY